MKKSPLISVIMPAYNVENYLERAVNSILRQSYQNFELLIIDDGSTDGTAKKISALAKKDQRITALTQKNQGVATARNTGLKKSHGSWVYFVDADDEVAKDALATMLAVAESTHVNLVCANFRKIQDQVDFPDKDSQNRQALQVAKVLNKEAALLGLLKMELPGGLWVKLYQGDLARKLKFNESYTAAEDLDFDFRFIAKIDQVAVCDQVVYFYRQTKDSLTRGAFKESRLSGLAAIQAIKKEAEAMPKAIREAAQNRLFQEACFINEMIVRDQKNPLVKHDPKRVKATQKTQAIIKLYRKKVLTSALASKRQRLFALLAMIHPKFPALSVNLAQKWRKRLR